MELKFNEAKTVRPNHLERCLCYDKFLKGYRCYVYDDISKYWCTQATNEHDPDGENHIVDYADYQVTEWASLQQEQPAKRGYKDCNGCEYNRLLKDQIGWQFRGCFGGDYKGKPIAEIELCPLKLAVQQEQPNDVVTTAKTFLDALSKTPYNNKPITDAQIIVKQLLLFFENPKEYNPDAILGQSEVDLEKASRNVYESWKGGTMDDFLRDMVELGKALNARKEK